MKTIIKITLSLLFIAASFTSCVDDKDFDTPQVTCDDSFITSIPEAQITTFENVFNQWSAANPTTWNDQNIVNFADVDSAPSYLIGYVISDDLKGNFYKELFFQDKIEDASYGLKLRIDMRGMYAKYPKGSKIYVQLNGLSIVKSHGEMVIGEVINGEMSNIRSAVAKNNIKRRCLVETITPKEINSSSEINDALLGQYIQINNAQFPLSLKDYPFADPNDDYDSLREMVFCEDQSTIKLETSSFAYYAENILPSTKFNLTGVLSRDYGNDFYVLKINTTEDFEILNDDRCDPLVLTEIFNEDFNDFSDWTNYSVTGAQIWESDSSYGNPDYCAKMSGYVSGNRYENEDWLITPAIDLSTSTNNILTFQTASNYSGPDLEVYVSNDYVPGQNPNDSGTWVAVSANLSQGSFTWTNSGEVDLSNYDGGEVYVGFKFTSTTSASATHEIDNVIVGYME